VQPDLARGREPRTASLKSELTSTWSNSVKWAISPRAAAMRRAISSGLSCPLRLSRSSSTCIEGGRRKTPTTSAGIAARICRKPCQSIVKIMSLPAASAASTGARGVP
jgi:hypothetical protein